MSPRKVIKNPKERYAVIMLHIIHKNAKTTLLILIEDLNNCLILLTINNYLKL